MADPRLVVARRELASLRAEKTILLAMLIQLVIAAFSSFLVVGLVSLYDPGTATGGEVTVAVSGDAREELLAVTREDTGIETTVHDSPDEARAAFERGAADAAVVARNRDGVIHVDVAVPDGAVETTVAVARMRDALRALERAEREDRAGDLTADPLALPPTAGGSPYYGFTYTVLVPLLLFLPVFISGSIAVDSVTEEIERGTLDLLRVAPLSSVAIVDGKLLAAAGIAPAQAALWLALIAVNGIRVSAPARLLVIVAGFSLGIVSFALVVGMAIRDRRNAQLLYSVGALLVFGFAAALPTNPANAAARLAVGSADTATSLLAVAYGVVGALAFLVLRRSVPRFVE